MRDFWARAVMAPEDGGGAADGGPSPAPGGGGDVSGAAAPQPFDWAGALGEAHATYAPLLTEKGWKNPADMLAAHADLSQQLAGRVAVPGEAATDEERAAFWNALGRPEAADGYKLAKPDEVPESAWNGERMGRFAAKAHELGLTSAQAEGIVAWLGTDIAQELEALPAQQEAAKAAIDAELSQAFGAQKPAKMELARRAFTAFAGAEADAIDALGAQIGDARVVQIFARIGEAMAEDSLVGGAGPRALTPEAAKAELQVKQRDQAFMEAVFSADHPQHENALKDWQALQLAARGQSRP